MEYELRITCFIDILGFQNHIDSTINKNLTDNNKNIKKISNALSIIRSTLSIGKFKSQETKMVTQFSDCIVISVCDTEESGVFWMLLEVQWLLLNLMSLGFMCRGGITYGKLLHTDTVVFGPALVQAYKMESEAALYPRVILHELIIELGGIFRSSMHSPDMEIEYIKNIVCKDADGMYYVNFLEKAKGEFDDPEYQFPEYLLTISRLIKSGLKTNNPSIYVKYNWLKERYNEVVIGYQKEDIQWRDSEIEQAYKSLPVFE